MTPADAPGRRPIVRPVPLAIGLGLALAVALIPSPLHEVEGFGHRPALAAAVAVLMAAWWFGDALPMAWTACLPLVLYPALDVFGRGPLGSLQSAAAPYGDAYIFLFFGGMMIGAAMEQWGLHRRVALHIMRAVGTTPRRLLFGVLLATALVSMWISNTATAVMMLPIGMALIAQLERGEGGRRLAGFGTAVMLAVAYGANVGGIGTKIGTGTNSIFAGFASKELGVEISFLEFAAVGIPFVVLFLPVVWWMLWQLGKRDRLERVHGREVLDRELAELGSLSGKERRVAVVFLCAALLWILVDPLQTVLREPLSRALGGARLAGKHFEAGISLAAALALWLWGTLTWRAVRKVPWGTLLLLGGSFAMAEGITQSGLAQWLTEQVAGLATMPLGAQISIATLATVLLSAVASNTATINVMLNVLPRSIPVLFGTAIAASCDFALPAGTPPNAIVFGSGYVRLPTMMKLGFLLDLAAFAAISLYAYFVIAAFF